MTLYIRTYKRRTRFENKTKTTAVTMTTTVILQNHEVILKTKVRLDIRLDNTCL